MANWRNPLSHHDTNEDNVPSGLDNDVEMEDNDVLNNSHTESQFDPPAQPDRATSASDRHARVDDVEDDEEDGGYTQWVEEHPKPAGTTRGAAPSYFTEI